MAPRFEELIRRHHDEIFAYLWRLLAKERKSDASIEVEDLVQEVFMRAYEAFAKLRQESNHRAWLYKIATNCALTKLRQTKYRRAQVLTIEYAARGADAPSSLGETDGRMRALVDALPVKQKTCVTLRYFHDLDYAEIAQIAGCSEESARANVYQGIQRLRMALQEGK